MKDLIEILNSAADKYYNANPIMSDHEYDKLYDELVRLESETGIIYPNSPTQKVGYTVLSSLEKVMHESKVLSLDKTKEIEKLESFLGDLDGVLSWKLDGLTIVLSYKNGALLRGITRGNGEVGEDVTHNVKAFKNVPLKIPYDGNLTIRGEAVISYSDFEKINENIANKEEYKNPRNLCSGTVRQLNSEICASRSVRFFAFAPEGDSLHDLKSKRLDFLAKLGFDVIEHNVVNKDTVRDFVDEYKNRVKEIDFGTDGLVLTYNSSEFSASLGVTSKFPKDSIAFKWADELAETKIISIDWNTSRTGLINPVAVFEPVELEGTTVNRASLHNLSVLEDLSLGIGDTVTVYKANMIIPQVAENLTKSGNLEIPDKCPVCGSRSEVVKQVEGKALFCPNTNCHAQIVRMISHFASRDAMNIEGLSEATIEKFVAEGFIQNYTDLYCLEKYHQKIINMHGFGEKSYKNLIESLEKSKDVKLPNFIYALGISQVGLSNAKLLCKYFDFELEKIKNASVEEMIEIDGYGEVISNSVFTYFNNEKNIELLNIIVAMLRLQIEPSQSEEKPLVGLTFVVTGDVNIFKNRKELVDKIEFLGGKTAGSVSSKTNYLINNDITSVSGKNKKAKDLGVEIISEEGFLELCEKQQ